MVSLLAAFQFLTILPGIIRRPFTPREIGGAVGWYPLVGLALGGVLYGLNAALHWIFPAALVAALTLTAWVVVTRALHLDGFMDTCDGLFGGFTPESRLEIMRDSRTGAFGAIGGMLLLLTKFAALISLPNLLPALLLAPMLARWGLTLAIFGFPYARQKGLGRDIKDHASWREIALASAISLAAAWLIGAWTGLVLLVLTALFIFLGSRYILRLIPGLTGDCYGAFCELIETVILLSLSISLTAFNLR